MSSSTVDGALDWKAVTPSDLDQIISESRRYCPALSAAAAPTTVEERRLACYPSHRLLRLEYAAGPGVPATWVFAFYAPGEFLALDSGARVFDSMNKLSPLKLTYESVLDYAIARLPFQLAAVVGPMTLPGGMDRAGREIRAPSVLVGADPSVGSASPTIDHVLKTDTSAPDSIARGEAYKLTMAVRIDLPDAKAARVEVVEVVVAESGALTVVRSKDSPSPAAAALEPRSRWFAPLHARPPTYVVRWDPPAREQELAYRQRLEPWRVRANDVLLRWCHLPFYKTFKLVEVVDASDGDIRRSYALISTEGESAAAVRPLSGQSSVIHDVNEIPGELVLNDVTVSEYISFFCWAVHGDEGPFYLPHAPFAVPFVAPLSAEQREQLLALDLGVKPVPDDERQELYKGDDASPDVLARKAIIVYSTAAWEAWFAATKDGEISMVHDDERVARLQPSREEFGKSDLFRLTPTPNPPRLPDQARAAAAAQPGRIITAAQCLTELRSSGEVSDTEIADALLIDEAGSTDWRLVNCRFREPIRLRRAAEGVRFKNCRLEGGLLGAGALAGTLRLESCHVAASSKAEQAGESLNIAIDLGSAHLRGELCLIRCAVVGRIFASGLHARRGRLHGCRIAAAEGQLPLDRALPDLDDARSAKGAFPGQGFGGVAAVSLVGARFERDLEIGVDAGERAKASDMLDQLTHTDSPHDTIVTSVGGELDIRGARVGGALTLVGLLCEGKLILDDCTIGQGVTCEVPAEDRAALVVRDDMSLANASIKGDVSLAKCNVGGGVSFYKATVSGNVNLHSTKIGSDLTFTFAQIRGFISANLGLGPESDKSDAFLSVGGDLLFSGGRFGFVEIRGAEIGSIESITGSFGTLSLTLGVRIDAASGRGWLRPCRIGSVKLQSIRVAQNLTVTGVQVGAIGQSPSGVGRGGSFTLVHSRLASALFNADDPAAALEERFRVDGTNFWRRPSDQEPGVTAVGVAASSVVPAAAVPTVADVHARIAGNLDLQANVIDGELDLRNVEVSGCIRLNDTRVRLDVRIDGAFEHDKVIRRGDLRTSCAFMDLEKVSCHGDVNLTGLHVRATDAVGGKPGNDTVSDHERGLLSGRGMTVKGEILLLPRQDDARLSGSNGELQTAGPMAKIEGALDLTAVTADHLVLTKSNVPDMQASPAPAASSDPKHSASGRRRPRVRLERGRFHRLEIVDPPPDSIDLSSITVGRWEFGRRNSQTGERLANQYTSILTKMMPFDRGTWIAVENDLRNEARDGDANQVYVAMRKMARNEIKREKATGPWNSVVRWARLLREFQANLWTRFGTQVWRPMVPVIPLLLLSIWLFADARNVRANAGLLQVVGDDSGAHDISVTEKSPVALGYHWALRDAAALALRYQVPMIEMLAHQSWEASDHPILGSFSAEDYAFLVELYHWVAWPLFLIGIGARVLRGKRGDG